MLPELSRIVLLGLGATAIMDAWSFVLRTLFGIRTLDYRLVGRWIGHFKGGRFVHDHIADSQPVLNENWLGWTAHYAIGMALAGLFATLIDRDWFASPRPEAAFLFGLITVLIPYLIMQPAFGLGIAGSLTSDPLSARLRSLATHAVFGLGLYLAAVLLVAIGI